MNVPDDTRIVDAIALFLGQCGDEWPDYDGYDVIADLIGEVRPHPGLIASDDYAKAFREATGREPQ